MDSSGAKSQVAGIVSAIVVMFVLLFLTPVFKNMPQNVQGAIVIAAVLGLFNYSEWFFLWKVGSQLLHPTSILAAAAVVLSSAGLAVAVWPHAGAAVLLAAPAMPGSCADLLCSGLRHMSLQMQLLV